MRAAPGAKIPPTTKYQTAWVKKLDSGMKKETRIHEIAADKLIEIKEPVMAFEVASPLRIKTLEIAKARAAWRAKYLPILHYSPEEKPGFEPGGRVIMGQGTN